MINLDKKQKEIDDYLDWAYKTNLSEESKMAGIKKISAKYVV